MNKPRKKMAIWNRETQDSASRQFPKPAKFARLGASEPVEVVTQRTHGSSSPRRYTFNNPRKHSLQEKNGVRMKNYATENHFRSQRVSEKITNGSRSPPNSDIYGLTPSNFSKIKHEDPMSNFNFGTVRSNLSPRTITGYNLNTRPMVRESHKSNKSSNLMN